MDEYIDCLKKYAVFAGRSCRYEFWMFQICNAFVIFCIGVVLSFIAVLAKTPEMEYLMFVYGLAMVLPGMAVTVRRLHDTGRSGWWLLTGLIPYVGVIVLLVLACFDSQPGHNAYGPNPKK